MVKRDDSGAVIKASSPEELGLLPKLQRPNQMNVIRKRLFQMRAFSCVVLLKSGDKSVALPDLLQYCNPNPILLKLQDTDTLYPSLI